MTETVSGSPAESVPRTEVRGMNSDAQRPCTFHVWFSPKRRAPALEGEIRSLVYSTLDEVARDRGVELMACGSLPDHIHLLLRLPQGMGLPQAMRYLKGTSAHRVLQTIPEVKLQLSSDHFWQRGYGSKPVPDGAVRATRDYIRGHGAADGPEPRTSVRGAASSRSDMDDRDRERRRDEDDD